jgi:pimeloyl-ACP methyl ester carboxylesterase
VPTLTGLGERAHLANPDVSLKTHIDDIVNVLVFEDLDAVTLVANSSGGTVITGVAEQAPERLERVVYLDAFVPADGQSTSDLVAPDRWATMDQLVQSEGDGWLLPRFSPAPWEPFVRDAWQVTDEEDLRWVLSRLRPTPVRHFTEPIHLGDAHQGGRPRRVYIRCRGNNPAPHFDRCAATAQSSPEWTYRELMLPHLPFITHPDETTQVLLEVVA